MIVCFDLETTGLDKYNDRIIEIAMVKFDENTFEVIDTYSTFIDPEIEIPDIISNITNIFDEDVDWAPLINDVKREVLDFIWNSKLLGHNVNFDIDFFVNNWIDVSNNIKIDTFFLANFLTFNNSSLNLEMLCNHYKIPFKWAHRALNDVKATIWLFKEQVNDFNNLSKDKKKVIYYIFNLSEDRNTLFIKDYLFWEYPELIDLGAFENILLNKIWKFTFTSEENELDLDNINIEEIFNFSETVEKRQNQIDMSTNVYNGLSNWKKMVIEAPTWLWKSFAYLIPAIIHSLKSWDKVFVTTKTKTLQDQLYFKDLSYLKEQLWYKFSFTKIKWKRNYISIKNFFDNIFLWSLSYSETSLYTKIALWLLETKYWELDDLTFYPDEYWISKNLNSDWFSSLSDKNQYKEYDFLYKARKKVELSNVVIINHSLLFSDLESENGLLSWMKNLIIDEWHNIEDSVTESLKERYSIKSLIENIDKVEKVFKIKNTKKIDLLNLKENLLSNLEVIDDYWFSYIDSKFSSEQQYKTLLLKDDFFNELDFKNIIKKSTLWILDIVDKLKVFEDYDFSKEALFLESIAKNINIIFDNSNSNKFIKIINYNDRQWLSFDFTLLNPWEYLYNNLWEKLDSCLLTSATLKIWDNFDYINNIMKLDNFEFSSFDSDFDYSKQATVFIPTDLWNIKNNNDEIVKFLKDFYLNVRWKVLTLLTSFYIIKKIYTDCNRDLKKEWINLYAQSIWWSKMKLITFFKDSPDNSILLWTDSFWEWVDIPWDDLKYIVIHKFPFQTPTDPIFQARSVFFKDPFVEYSIPKAIIKLKQWFWRLIRTKTDKWVVILLDDRIVNTRWWNKFYEAFPSNINIKRWNSKQFLDILEKKG